MCPLRWSSYLCRTNVRVFRVLVLKNAAIWIPFSLRLLDTLLCFYRGTSCDTVHSARSMDFACFLCCSVCFIFSFLCWYGLVSYKYWNIFLHFISRWCMDWETEWSAIYFKSTCKILGESVYRVHLWDCLLLISKRPARISRRQFSCEYWCFKHQLTSLVSYH